MGVVRRTVLSVSAREIWERPRGALYSAMPEPPETFTCSECGALYEVTRTNFPEPVEDCAECVECGCLMCEWSTTSVPLHRLIRTADGRTPPDKPIA
jgi:hypothetical protein